MFPPGTLQGWLGVIVRVNPVTYVVDAMRRTLPGLPYGNDPSAAPTIWGWQPPLILELACLGLLTVVLLILATHRFQKEQ